MTRVSPRGFDDFAGDDLALVDLECPSDLREKSVDEAEVPAGRPGQHEPDVVAVVEVAQPSAELAPPGGASGRWIAWADGGAGEFGADRSANPIGEQVAFVVTGIYPRIAGRAARRVPVDTS